MITKMTTHDKIISGTAKSSAADTNLTAAASFDSTESDSEEAAAVPATNATTDPPNQDGYHHHHDDASASESLSLRHHDIFSTGAAAAADRDEEEGSSDTAIEKPAVRPSWAWDDDNSSDGGESGRESTTDDSDYEKFVAMTRSIRKAEASPASSAGEAAAVPAVALNEEQLRTMNAASPDAEASAVYHQVDDDHPCDQSEDEDCEDIANFIENCAQSRCQKDRTSQNTAGSEVGAMQVDEQAPQLERRTFLGLDRPSVILRNAQAREARAAARRRRSSRRRGATSGEEVDNDGNNNSSNNNNNNNNNNNGGEQHWRPTSDDGGGRRRSVIRRMNTLIANIRRSDTADLEAPRVSANGEHLVNAVLVEDRDEQDSKGECVVAEPVSYFARKWKVFGCAMSLLLATMAVVLVVYVANDREDGGDEAMIVVATDVPSLRPSSPPSFDSRPTLEIVRERGRVRCGLKEEVIESGEGFYLDLCRAVAAVLFGNPNSIEQVPVIYATRFHQLRDRGVDLVLYGDTHTVEREVKERMTGAPFTFSSPYFYDGLTYFGKEEYVACAEEPKRYGECASLRICVLEDSTGHDFVSSSFPPSFFTVCTSLEEATELLLNGACNVISAYQTDALKLASSSHVNGDELFAVGVHLMTKEPLAIVTRPDDREFSDVIDWVLQALFYGEERDLTRNPSLCLEYDDMTTHRVADLDFLNAVHCVGNYADITFAGDRSDRGMNQINDGSTGMIYATPFGHLDKDDAHHGATDVAAGTLFHDIREKEFLNCGVAVPDDFEGSLGESRELVGMSVEYCRALAAVLFNGDFNLVNLIPFSEGGDGSLAALGNGTIDVLAGGTVEKKYDFGGSPSVGGVHFSTPYYYGNEAAGHDVGVFALATPDDDVLFASFVNCVVLATIDAQEKGITKAKGKEMPLLSIFGSELKFLLRDAVLYSGTYEEIYRANFGDVSKEERGRNYLNEYGTPQFNSFPGLSL